VSLGSSIEDHQSGRVYLVGAGPGDPELLTIKAHRVLRRADVVLHDALISREILALASARAQVVNVGKRCGARGVTQGEINRQMIEGARQGLEVVRLKSGDPGVFGRLAEEIDALDAAGICFEVIPGITAGFAAAASLGTPLTDRRTSSRVVILTNHQASAARNDWPSLASGEATFLIYMPGRNLAALRDKLLLAGLPPDLPAVIVSRLSEPNERTWASSLGELGSAPVLDAPSLLVIGRCLARSGEQVRARLLSAACAQAARSPASRE
jgi:uroporphyrin-III C-methyltransferase